MHLRRCVFVALSTFAFVANAAAQQGDPVLRDAIMARDKAAGARDIAGVDKYTADDYVAVNPQGQLNDKKQRLEGMKQAAAPSQTPFEPLRIEAIRMYGSNAAVVRTKQPTNRRLEVWVKNPSGWQMTAIHVVPDTFMPAQQPQQILKAPEPSAVPAMSGLSGDRAAIYAAFKSIQDAVWNGDAATYEKLTAPESVRLSPGILRFGVAENPAASNGIRKPPLHSNITVSAWGDVGLVRWYEKTAPGQETWLTRVMVKKPSGWQQIATASSLAGTQPTR